MKQESKQIKGLMFRLFPQNYLIKNPLVGALLFFVVLFVFVIVYRPLQVSENGLFSFNQTMLAYSAIVSVFELLIAWAISRTNFFFSKGSWTIVSELLSIVTILAGIGIAAYFAGFLLEPASSRWNFSTFFDSFYRSILIALFPVCIPTILNIRYAFAQEIFQNYDFKNTTKKDQEVVIKIESKAKKEHLEFYPHEFIFAESDGNYVVFHLLKQGHQKNVSIRNSIKEIEAQLSDFPDFMRTHRAFIVNLNKITSSNGNALGYRLKLSDCKDIIPVSRQNARKFEQLKA